MTATGRHIDALRVEEGLGRDLIRDDPIAAHVRAAVLHGADLTSVLLLALKCALESNRELTRDALGHLALCSRPIAVHLPATEGQKNPHGYPKCVECHELVGVREECHACRAVVCQPCTDDHRIYSHGLEEVQP